jgi:hypothetical protein
MAGQYRGDLIDGREVPPLVVSANYGIDGVHTGSVRVEAGTFTLSGTLRGSLNIQPGAKAAIGGRQQGSVAVESGATVVVAGAIEGSTSVQRGAVVIVEPGGKLAGSLHNDGLVVVRGVFGGSRTGSGELRLEGGGYVKQPSIRDGIHFYEW